MTINKIICKNGEISFNKNSITFIEKKTPHASRTTVISIDKLYEVDIDYDKSYVIFYYSCQNCKFKKYKKFESFNKKIMQNFIELLWNLKKLNYNL